MRWLWVSLAVLAWSLPAGAQTEATRAAARTLGMEGVEALEAGRYREAVDKLERAFNVVRAPSIGLWSARALDKAGKWVEAAERYLEASRLDPSSGDANVQRQAQADAVREREELLARLPALHIQVKGVSSNATVTIDGAPLPSALLGAKVPVNPGVHVVRLFDGDQRRERRVQAQPRGTVAVMLDLAAPPGSSDTLPSISPKPGLTRLQVTGVVVGGVGVLGLGLGGYFALRASSLDRQSKEGEHCDANNVCDAAGYARRGDAVQHATAATVATIAGSVLTAAGVTLVLVGGDKRENHSTLVQARPATAGLAGLELCGHF